MRGGVFLIGVAGNIASGKSTVLRALKAKLGDKVHVINCDKLAQKTYQPGTQAYNALVETFGTCILVNDGSEVDRSKLGSIVFADEEKRAKLNGIVWPATWKGVQEEIEEVKGAQVYFLEAALLLQAGWDKECDECWYLTCEENTAVQRASARQDDPEVVRRRWRVQNSDSLLESILRNRPPVLFKTDNLSVEDGIEVFMSRLKVVKPDL